MKRPKNIELYLMAEDAEGEAFCVRLEGIEDSCEVDGDTLQVFVGMDAGVDLAATMAGHYGLMPKPSKVQH